MGSSSLDGLFGNDSSANEKSIRLCAHASTDTHTHTFLNWPFFFSNTGSESTLGHMPVVGS